MESKKKSMILSIIAIITFVALVVGATYAYFQATGGIGSNSKVNVETATTDVLTFNFSKGIAIYADQSNFGKGAGNQSDSTKGTATLSASNSKNIESTTDRYNIYFIISENDFEYTTSDNKTELLLQVTDPNGNEVTAIDGLVYENGGFDITTKTGGFLLVPDYDITAARGEMVSQNWNIKVTLVNLDTNQSANMGKAFKGTLYMTKEQMSSYELTEITNMTATTTYNSIETTLDVTSGSAEIDKYYFAYEKVNNTTSFVLVNRLSATSVNYVESDKPTYKFTGLDSNSTYKIYSYAVDKNGIKSNVYETEIKTEEYVLPTVDVVNHSSTLNSITVSVTASKGSNEIAKYFYSKDDGETFAESESNTYTFDGLSDTAQYKIVIKVQDTEGNFSTVYSEAIDTITYVQAKVNSVTATTKYNKITVNTTATGGTNEVSKYYYSINNGAYVEDGASHTFTGLTEQTTYTIKVKVADTQGRESVEYSTSAKTDAYKLPTVTITSTSSTSNSITINVTGTNGDGTITEYYYSKDNGSNYTKATTNTYTFTGLTSNATFNVKVYVKDANGRSSSEVATTIKTTLPTLSDTCSSGTNLASCIKTYYTSYGSDVTNVYYHDSTLTNGAGDNSYRYAGSSSTTNNYVCFGSDAATCPDDNLYRIIGVFDGRVRLIKADYATSDLLGTDTSDYYGLYSDTGYSTSYYQGDSSNLTNIAAYYWNKANYSASYSATGYSNDWSYSELNKTHLNKNFLENIGSAWANMIDTTTWKVGGNTYETLRNSNANTAYTNEITSPSTQVTNTYDSKVGLMYVSDYYYGASPTYWTYPGYSSSGASYDYRAATGENWMYMGLYEWTMARSSSYSNNASNVNAAGSVYIYHVDGNAWGARPVFHLTSKVEVLAGNGEIGTPLRISAEA